MVFAVCDQCPENTLHALIHCDTPKEVWSNWLNCPVEQETNSGDYFDLALQFITNGTTQDLETFFSSLPSLFGTTGIKWYMTQPHHFPSKYGKVLGELSRTTKVPYNFISAEIQPSFVLDCPPSWHSQIWQKKYYFLPSLFHLSFSSSFFWQYYFQKFEFQSKIIRSLHKLDIFLHFFIKHFQLCYIGKFFSGQKLSF